VTDKHDRKESSSFKDYENFQRNTYDKGGQVPLFQYSNWRKPSKSMRKSARFVGLCVLSAIIILFGVATERYVFLAILIVIGLWILLAVASKRSVHNGKKKNH
jgi:hypothetical protein